VEFQRDRLTWLAYALLAWFAYLQAAPGLVVPHLRDELGIGYTTGGLHVAAFATGSLLAGFAATRLEARHGRRAVLWGSALLMMIGFALLTLGRVPALTIGALLIGGCGGGLLLITDQALLADHHARFRAVALTEANVAASVSYVILVGALSLAAAGGIGWRAALLASFAVPLLAFARTRQLAIDAPVPGEHVTGRLSGPFYIAAAMMFCTVAAEWCVTAWGASFAEEAADVSADTAVALMFGYFGGVLVGRITGSRLARAHSAQRLLALALVVAAAGFALLWPAASQAQTLAGLAVIGLGLGNLFPFALAVCVALAPDQAQLASSRAVLSGSAAVLLAPLTIGALADATSIHGALLVVPVMLALAAAGLFAVTR
jgi:fucose permease